MPPSHSPYGAGGEPAVADPAGAARAAAPHARGRLPPLAAGAWHISARRPPGPWSISTWGSYTSTSTPARRICQSAERRSARITSPQTISEPRGCLGALAREPADKHRQPLGAANTTERPDLYRPHRDRQQ